MSSSTTRWFASLDVTGKMPDGAATPFTRIANGVPGLAARLPLMFSEGVNKGRLRLPEFVALASTNAARLYGIYPRKGSIAIGADADLAIWNPDREVVIRHELLHDNVDYTPYEGMVVKGWPEITISRGDVVFGDGRLVGTPTRRLYPWASPRTLATFPTLRMVYQWISSANSLLLQAYGVNSTPAKPRVNISSRSFWLRKSTWMAS